MTTVPPEYEQAARDVAKHYDVTEEEIDSLASDDGFAIGAYLRKEIGQAIDGLEAEISVDPNVSLDVEENTFTCDAEVNDDLDEEEKLAFRAAFGSYVAMVEATDHLADAALGRDVEELPFRVKIVRMLSDMDRSGVGP